MKNKLLAGLLISLLLCVNSYAQVKIERGLYIFQGGVRVSATNTNPPSPGIDFQVDGTNACDYLFVSKSITFTNGTSFNALNVADWNTATNFMDWLTTNTYVKSETDPVWSGVSNQYLFASIFTNWLDTNTYVKVELDPVWSGVSNQYLFASIFTNWLDTNTYEQITNASAISANITPTNLTAATGDQRAFNIGADVKLGVLQTNADARESAAVHAADTNTLQTNINSLSNFVVNTSFHPYVIPFATSNDISLANGAWQYYAPTNTTTIYLPTAATNMGHSLRIDIYAGTNSFTITNSGSSAVVLGTAYVTNSGVGALIFDKPFNSATWRAYTLP